MHTVIYTYAVKKTRFIDEHMYMHFSYSKHAYMMPHSAFAAPHQAQHFSTGLHAEVVETAVNMCRSHKGAPVAAV